MIKNAKVVKIVIHKEHLEKNDNVVMTVIKLVLNTHMIVVNHAKIKKYFMKKNVY